MSNNGVNEILSQVKTLFTEPELPLLDKIEIKRKDLNSIIRDVISDSITRYDWLQIIGTVILSVGGIFVSLFSSTWCLCLKLIVFGICVVLGAGLLILQQYLKKRYNNIQDIVSTIDYQITCYLKYEMSYEEWQEDIKNKNQEADEQAKQIINGIKAQRKDTKRKMKKPRRKP